MKKHHNKIFACLLALFLACSGMAFAQDKQERAASGNTNSLGTTARIDAVQETVRRFISGQETTLHQTELTIDNQNAALLTRLGQMRNTLINFNQQGGCDPALGPHGCSCACAGANQKLLWTGNKWQCYTAQGQCPSGQTFNPQTCKCETTTGSCTPQTPPQTCPAGQQWNQATCRCCSSCNIGECPAGMSPIDAATATACGLSRPCICNDYEVVTQNGVSRAMINPDLRPYVNLVTENGCERITSCKYGMDRSGRSCCCGNGQRLVNNTCGDVCPAGSTPSWIGHANEILGGCYEYVNPTGNICPDGYTMDNGKCRKGVPATIYGTTQNAGRCVP
jgi:hypothetical protein